MSDFTGAIGNNPGLTITANRSAGNGNLTVATAAPQRRPRAAAAAAPAANNRRAACSPRRLSADEPTPPAASTCSIRICRCRSPTRWTLGVPARARHAVGDSSPLRRHAQPRSVGRRSTTTRRTSSRTGSSTSSSYAQANLQAHIAAGCGGTGSPACSFAYRGPGTGTVAAADLPGVLQRQPHVAGGRLSRYSVRPTGRARTSSTRCRAFNPNPFTPAGTNANTGLAGQSDAPGQRHRRRAARRTSSARTPTCSAARASTGIGGFTRLQRDAVAVPPAAVGRPAVRRQLHLRRGVDSSRYSFRVPRVSLRASAPKATSRMRSRRPASTSCRSAAAGGSAPTGTGGRRLHRRLACSAARRASRAAGCSISATCASSGMSEDEVQDLFKLRLGATDDRLLVAAGHHRRDDQGLQHQRDVADRLRRARRAERPLLRARERAGLHREDRNIDYGDCGVRSLIVTGPVVQTST